MFLSGCSNPSQLCFSMNTESQWVKTITQRKRWKGLLPLPHHSVSASIVNHESSSGLSHESLSG